MESDKELLELAAKAAGFSKINYSSFDGMEIRYGFSEAIWNGDEYWNPLTDDGHALRLAVKLGLNVDIHRKHVLIESPFVEVRGYERRRLIAGVGAEDNGTSLEAATRRAIVIAAADIGKLTP